MVEKRRAMIELVLGLVGVFGYIWLIYPQSSLWVQVVVFIPIIIFLLFSDIVQRVPINQLGLRWCYGASSAKLLALFTLSCIPLLYGLWGQFFPVSSSFYLDLHFWQRLLVYPVWALFQQYLVLAFFFRRYRIICSSHIGLAIFLSAATFSLVHIPTPPLLIFCFISGIVWAAIYHRFPNLYTIALSHAILGTFCSQVLLVYSTVGPYADRDRWSKGNEPIVLDKLEGAKAQMPNTKSRWLKTESSSTER